MFLVFTLPLLFLALFATSGIGLWFYGVLTDRAWSYEQLAVRALLTAVLCMVLLGLTVWLQ